MAAASDAAPVNQPVSALPCPALSSPLSVSSHTGAQSASGSSCTDELRGAKTNGVPTTPISKVEPPRIVNPVGSVTASAMMPSGMPYFILFILLMCWVRCSAICLCILMVSVLANNFTTTRDILQFGNKHS